MNQHFFFEDGQSNVFDEHGKDAEDIEEETDSFNITSLVTLSRYRSLQSQVPFELSELTTEHDIIMEEIAEKLSQQAEISRKYNAYSDTQKAVFYYFNRIKLWKAASSGRKAQVETRTAQKWAKRLKEDPTWNINEKDTNKANRAPSQLQEQHKQFLINFFDEYPRATRMNAVERLTEAFEGFSLKKTSVRNFILHECNLTVKRVTLHPEPRNSSTKIEERYNWVKQWVENSDISFLENCVFVDESAFNINMRSPNARSTKGTPAIVKTPSTSAISHTILGAISARDVISIEIRVPLKPKRLKVDGAKKRKKTPATKQSKGTVTGHYLRFISKALDEMDKFPDMKNFYIVMNNAPIHTSKDITIMIESRGYRAIYLPPYFPELNPIENFWSIVKTTLNEVYSRRPKI